MVDIFGQKRESRVPTISDEIDQIPFKPKEEDETTVTISGEEEDGEVNITDSGPQEVPAGNGQQQNGADDTSEQPQDADN